jgi:hypothetical protein
MYYHPPVKAESSNTAAGLTGAGIVGGVLGAVLGGDRQGG